MSQLFVLIANIKEMTMLKTLTLAMLALIAAAGVSGEIMKGERRIKDFL